MDGARNTKLSNDEELIRLQKVNEQLKEKVLKQAQAIDAMLL